MRDARGRTSRAAWGPPGEAPAVLRSLRLSEGRWQTETAAGRGPPVAPGPALLCSSQTCFLEPRRWCPDRMTQGLPFALMFQRRFTLPANSQGDCHPASVGAPGRSLRGSDCMTHPALVDGSERSGSRGEDFADAIARPVLPRRPTLGSQSAAEQGRGERGGAGGSKERPGRSTGPPCGLRGADSAEREPRPSGPGWTAGRGGAVSRPSGGRGSWRPGQCRVLDARCTKTGESERSEPEDLILERPRGIL